MKPTEDKSVVQEFVLHADEELRFEVESKAEKVCLTLTQGLAEIFGTELVKGKPYEFTAGAKIAVFSYQGCSLLLTGKTDVSYVARETPMTIYCNCHAALEDLRSTAEKSGETGPVTLLVGPCDVGKSTVCRILLNYAVRMGRRPLFVDLDVGQGQISVGGSIGALLIERVASVQEGFSQEAPYVCSFGYKTPEANTTLFSLLCKQLAAGVKEKLETSKKVKSSGVIINTCGWIKGNGYKHLTQMAQLFEVDIILVLGQERLYNELVRDMPNFVKVVYLPKSGGVVERSQSTRSEARDQRIREYFYGTPKFPVYPHSYDIKWSEIKMFKIGAPALPDSCLPLGMKADDHLTKVVPLMPNPGMLHHLFSVSYATKEDEIITSYVAGFVCITHIDMERQFLTLLAPQPKPLPNNILLWCDLQFMDSH